MNGTVKFWNAERGFGFITPDDGGREVHVSWRNIIGQGRKDLRDGEEVEFETQPGKDGKGPTAVNVKRTRPR